jgi:hypothetical protein
MPQFISPARRSLAAVLVGLVAATACEQIKSATPLSPSLAGPIEGVTITVPPQTEPAAGRQIRDTEQPITLAFGNPETNSVRPYTLQLQIAVDGDFGQVVYSQNGIEPAGDGQNRLTLPAKLQPGRTYFWRLRADDGANASEWSPGVRFDVLQPIVIGVAEPLSPVGNVRVTTNTPVLRVRNGASSGPYGQLFYQFQASTSPAFSGFVGNQSVPEGNGETTLQVPGSPGADMAVYWRVRISDEQGNAGDWSRTESYRTPLAAAAPTPTPTPTPGGPSVSSDPFQVVACERTKFGRMSDGQMYEFMVNVARSLNANGVSGAPFGILRKTGGHNCNGYSCDVICAGNGGSQRQWDVLGDIDGAQTATWSGPLPTIRVDICTVP